MQDHSNKLVDARGLLDALFADGVKPTIKWVRNQQKARVIPFKKIGRLVFFDVQEVRAALNRRNTVRGK